MSRTLAFSRARKVALALSMGLVALLAETGARAQELVEDPTLIAKSIAEFAQQAERWAATQAHWVEQRAQEAAQYGKVLQHYQDQVAFWQQQLSDLEHLNFSIFKLESRFQRVPSDYGVDIACSSHQSLMDDITGALKSNILPNPDGDIRMQQTQLCQKIVMTKNRKYNNTVDYLQNIGAATSELTTIETNRNKAADDGKHITQGDLAANDNDVARFQSRVAKAREEWQSNNEALDVQISLLETQQSTLAQRAMKGKPSVAGQVIQAATLGAALKIGD